ncbi:hypothetical protein WG924_06190 [Tistrella sp. 25B02-3]
MKSACLLIGSVASNVALLISRALSNQGTNTTPRGGRSLPRVSTRMRMPPRREVTSTSLPRRGPRAGIVGMHETLAIPPQGLLAVDHRPARAASTKSWFTRPVVMM